MPRELSSKKHYLKTRDGQFAGSIPSSASVPRSTPAIPKPTQMQSDVYQHLHDGAAQERNNTNFEVAEQIDKAIDALEEYARENQELSQNHLEAWSVELDALAERLEKMRTRLDELSAENTARIEELKRKRKKPTARLLRKLRSIFR